MLCVTPVADAFTNRMHFLKVLDPAGTLSPNPLSVSAVLLTVNVVAIHGSAEMPKKNKHAKLRNDEPLMTSIKLLIILAPFLCSLMVSLIC